MAFVNVLLSPRAAMQGQNDSGCASGLASILDPNDQLHCGTLSGQSPYAWQPAEQLEQGPWGFCLVGSSYTECLASV